MTDIKKTLSLSLKIPDVMKTKITPYLNSSSRYKDGKVYGLKMPSGLSKISSKISGCSFGADKD